MLKIDLVSFSDAIFTVPGHESKSINYTRVVLQLPFSIRMPKEKVVERTQEALGGLYDDLSVRTKGQLMHEVRTPSEPPKRCFGTIYRGDGRTGLYSVELYIRDFSCGELLDYLSDLESEDPSGKEPLIG